MNALKISCSASRFGACAGSRRRFHGGAGIRVTRRTSTDRQCFSVQKVLGKCKINVNSTRQTKRFSRNRARYPHNSASNSVPAVFFYLCQCDSNPSPAHTAAAAIASTMSATAAPWLRAESHPLQAQWIARSIQLLVMLTHDVAIGQV